jgi:Rieske Fe-S protein
VFDEQGNVVSGPVPRPLDRFEVMVEDEQLYLRGV